jgi:pimeloyl-ACP methyl ester carboxylesterase
VRRVGLALALAVLVPASPAAAIDRYVPMKTPPGPGPAKYDRVFVKQLGPRGADTVLVLVPGTLGGAGNVVPVARDIVRRVPRLQVWVVDRREQAFEDTSVFRTGDPQRAQEYYLGFQYRRVLGTDARFVADWGLKLQLTDLRSVVSRARRGGRRVILGGHSAGASTAVAYAAWDFRGRPGYRDLSGLVLIDAACLAASGPRTSRGQTASSPTSAAVTSSTTSSSSASRRSARSSRRSGRSGRPRGRMSPPCCSSIRCSRTS